MVYIMATKAICRYKKVIIEEKQDINKRLTDSQDSVVEATKPICCFSEPKKNAPSKRGIDFI